MSFGNILGQIMQKGLGGQTQTRDRLRDDGEATSTAGGGGLDSIFGQLQGALGRAVPGAGQAAGGFADKAEDFLRTDQVGNLSGAQIGGIGAIAGALLGGGLGGAARGGAMAVLGTLALGALKRAQAQRAGHPEPATGRAGGDPGARRARTASALLLTAMISAAKADGQIDQAEMQKIIGKISADDVTPEEKQFVLDQMSAPLDLARARRRGALAGAGGRDLRGLDPRHRRRHREGAALPRRPRRGAPPRRGDGGAAPPDDRHAAGLTGTKKAGPRGRPQGGPVYSAMIRSDRAAS